MAKYWFARRWPVESPRNTMAPVSREGFIVAWVFVALMVIGGLGLMFFGLNGQIISGAVMFGALSLLGGAMFIGMAWGPRGDKKNTVADYKSGKVQNP